MVESVWHYARENIGTALMCGGALIVVLFFGPVAKKAVLAVLRFSLRIFCPLAKNSWKALQEHDITPSAAWEKLGDGVKYLREHLSEWVNELIKDKPLAADGTARAAARTEATAPTDPDARRPGEAHQAWVERIGVGESKGGD